jgi:fluoride exporter
MLTITTEPSVVSRRLSTGTATTMSPASIERPPTRQSRLETTIQDPPRVYHPFSPAVVALLMPASVFGVLARLGLQALGTYNGKSIFPLAYPQAVGCLIMGIALPLKDTIGD